ncbi:MAG: DegV family protein [Angelakisella sp.]|jgi:DegV family protein with EDD domain|nr:DegV family protein [Angelakisella sp.]MCI9667424.1 DegV family protein [Angelakisella sp.]
MEQNYVIVTDSSCDLPAELAQELELAVLPLTLTLGGKEYANYLDGREIGFSEFYGRIRQGEVAVTAAANLEGYLSIMEPILQAGKDILLLVFSSGLSSTYQVSLLAAEELSQKYPQRKILPVDTLCASMGQGLLVYLAARQRGEGKSLQEVRDWVEKEKYHLCHWFTVDDLMYLKRGGRLNAATALVGTALGIKPVLHIDNEGHLINMGKARGRRASLTALVDKMAELAVEPQGQVAFISHGDCLEDAKAVEQMLKQRLGVKKVIISYVGPVIGAHTGPGVVALFFLGKER